MTEDKIKEAAERIYPHSTRSTNFYSETINLRQAFVLGVTSQVAKEYWASKQGEWISVKDNVPEYGTEVNVIVVNGNRVVTSLARYTRSIGSRIYYWDNAYPGKGNYHAAELITHWMPLPQPPKFLEETNNSKP